MSNQQNAPVSVPALTGAMETGLLDSKAISYPQNTTNGAEGQMTKSFKTETPENVMGNTASGNPGDVNAEAQSAAPTFGLATISAADLQKKEIPPVKWVVEGLIPPGLSMLVAKPKFGKSWAVLELGLAVASGNRFLGFPTNPGEVLCLALEDSEARLQDRLTKQWGDTAAPAGLHFVQTAPNLDGNFIEVLEVWLSEHPGTTLVIVDTLQYIRGAMGCKENVYAYDCRELARLKTFADEHGIAMLLVHHTRKRDDFSDPFNCISGTNGLLGTADTVLMLKKENRAEEKTILSVVGRDVCCDDLVIQFNPKTFRWENLGTTKEQARRDYANLVQFIKTLIDESPEKKWEGHAQELLDEADKRNWTILADSARTLSNKLNKLEAPLLEHDGIVHERQKNGTGGGTHRFYYAERPVF